MLCMRSRLIPQVLDSGTGLRGELVETVVSISSSAGLLQSLADVAKQHNCLAGHCAQLGRAFFKRGWRNLYEQRSVVRGNRGFALTRFSR
jgi:hypothetical protein